MEAQHVLVAVSVASLLLNIGIAAIAATWGISKIRITVSQEIAKQRTDFDARLLQHAREFGETASAIRAKVHEVELWARDTFVRRESFLRVVDEVRTGFSDLGARLEKRMGQIEERLFAAKD